MAGVAKGSAGLGAQFYVAYRVWQSLARADRRVPDAPPIRHRTVHHVLHDGSAGHDKRHHVARCAGHGEDAGYGEYINHRCKYAKLSLSLRSN